MSKLFLSKKMSMEYLTIDGLEKRTGVNSNDFESYVLKELIDNALDTCESIEKKPEITVTTKVTDNQTTISVKDNGEGIAKKDLETVFDFTRFSGTKYYRKNVTRGAQGNALMTILGIPYAITDKNIPAPLTIISLGEKHSIRIKKDDIMQDTTAEIETLPTTENGGTTIQVLLTRKNNDTDETEKTLNKIVQGFVLVNPHTKFKYNGQQLSKPKEYNRYNGPESIHWYRPNDFVDLVFAHIRYLEENKEKMSLINFAKTFKGLSSNKITHSIKGRCKWLNDLKEEKEIVAWLKDLKNACKAPKARVFNAIGKEHFLDFVQEKEIVEHKYAKTEGENNGVPFVIEVFVAEKPAGEKGEIFFGVNNTITYELPLNQTSFKCLSSYGLRSEDSDFDSNSLEALLVELKINENSNVFVAFHLTAPNIKYTGYGKSSFEGNFAAEPLQDSLVKCSKFFFNKKMKQLKRFHTEERKCENNQKRENNSMKQDLNKLIFQHLPAAWNEASNNNEYFTSQRNLFYKVRPKIQEEYSYETWGGENKDYNYFKTILAQYEIKNSRIEKLVRESSAFLQVPHTPDKIDLATDAVNDYHVPRDTFNKLLYIEKRGLVKLLIQNNFHNKYDLALVGGMGKASFGVKDLLKKVYAANITIFTLHDCDIDGYEIAQTTKQESANYKDYNILAIDMGLSVSDVKELDLEVEKQSRTKDIPNIVKETASAEELEWLRGEEEYGKRFTANRVELDALTPKQLIEFIEKKLGEHGVKEKVLPSDKVIDRKVNEFKEDKVREIIDEQVNTLLCLEDLKEHVYRETEKSFCVDAGTAKDCLVKELADFPLVSWNNLLSNNVSKQLNDNEDAKEDTIELVRELVLQAIKENRKKREKPIKALNNIKARGL